MKKKYIYIFITLMSLAILYFVFSFIFMPRSFDSKNCSFCNPKIIEYQKYYEDDLVMGLYTHRPVTKGHCLIVPKRHIERFEELDQYEISSVFSTIKKTDIAAKKVVNADSYLIFQKSGKSVGQTVPHVHFHYIPRSANQKNLFYFMMQFIFNPLKPFISNQEMEKMVYELSNAI